MNSGKTVLAQVLAGLSGEEFSRCAAQYPMARDTPALSAYDHFATMVFAQLTYRESLRDIEVCLNARRPLLYHAGIRGAVKRCNLAYANEHRDWRLFAEIAGVLMRRARRLYADEPAPLDLDAELFALDATLIELSVALFPWARWQGTHAAVKLNVLLDLRADLPAFASLHEGSRHEVAALDEIPVLPGAYYVMDRGYLDFGRLHRLHAAGAFFVTRLKTNTRYYVVASRPVAKSSGQRCDQTIRLNSPKGQRSYPEVLRRISYVDPETGLWLVFLTNQFALDALTIALIYQHRWRIELFSAGSNSTCDSAASSAPIPTACGCRSGPRYAPTCWSPSPNAKTRCSAVFIRFCKLSRLLPWRKSLSQSCLRKSLQRTRPSIQAFSWKSTASDQTAVGSAPFRRIRCRTARLITVKNFLSMPISD